MKKKIRFEFYRKIHSNEDEVNTHKIEVAKQKSEEMIKEKIEKTKEEKEEELMPEVNGIKLALKPISGTITSRYGESSSLRESTHTGLDIAATTGTPIKVVADGIVTNASYSGSYGNLVKISHGDGVETWYAHTSKCM
ncbi:MAG: M23 family metallopeptidase [Clostridia bacterium]